MAENPELLNKMIFRRASVANWVNDDTGDCEHEFSVVQSQECRPGRKRKDCYQSEQHNSKLKRCDHHRCGSHYLENQVMDQSPTCWIDPFQAKFVKQRLTQVAPTSGRLSRDVIQLKQVAL